jgi:hypothetical protein
MHRKNRIIQKRKNKEDPAKNIKEEKDCVSVAYTVLQAHLGGVQPKGSSESPGGVRGGVGSHPTLQLTSAVDGISPLLGTTSTWTVERSRKTGFSRTYIIFTYIQFAKHCLPIRIG